MAKGMAAKLIAQKMVQAGKGAPKPVLNPAKPRK